MLFFYTKIVLFKDIPAIFLPLLSNLQDFLLIQAD